MHQNEKILIVEDESVVALDLKLILTKAGYKVCGIAHSVAQAIELITTEKPEMVLLDIYLKGALTGIDLAKTLAAQNIPFVYLSANFQESLLEKAKVTQPYGFLVKPFREKELLVTLDVAFYRHRHSIESKLRQEQELEDLISKSIVETAEWDHKLLKIASFLQPHILFDYLSIMVETQGEFLYNGINFFRIGFDEYQCIGINELLTITKLKPEELKIMQESVPINTQAGFFNGEAFNLLLGHYALKKVIAKTFDLKSVLLFPLLMPAGNIINCSFYSCKEVAYTSGHLSLLSRLQQQLIRAMEMSILNEDFEQPLSKIKSNPENQPISNSKTAVFENMIGQSHQMLSVQDLVYVVAPLDTSVLILGETGTGKELIAKSVHQLSSRKKKPFVIVNCATLPAQLIESELFGHEKGSFTGAFEKKTGKFEQAEGGSIFLDEIGELAFDLQAKLLRVLQEREFERIGGNKTIKCDVRVIAATNRVLENEVIMGKFRSDLYYRLSVFPVLLPPLRDRKEDIILLSNHFAQGYSSRMNKTFQGISESMLESLKNYHWPGNIRELENVIEQAVILNENNKMLMLTRQLSYTGPSPAGGTHLDSDNAGFTKAEMEKAEISAICEALRQTKGRIRGESGAAAFLGINPTTLESKMKKYGISKYLFDRLGN